MDEIYYNDSTRAAIEDEIIEVIRRNKQIVKEYYRNREVGPATSGDDSQWRYFVMTFRNELDELQKTYNIPQEVLVHAYSALSPVHSTLIDLPELRSIQKL